uniref:Uncharacterized protein n=1 Tax=Anguilla anguilla TaxID=7936 RepID=A0A0E9PT50_ANGAN
MNSTKTETQFRSRTHPGHRFMRSAQIQTNDFSSALP